MVATKNTTATRRNPLPISIEASKIVTSYVREHLPKNVGRGLGKCPLHDNWKSLGSGKNIVVKDIKRSDYRHNSDTTQYTSGFHRSVENHDYLYMLVATIHILDDHTFSGADRLPVVMSDAFPHWMLTCRWLVAGRHWFLCR